RDLLGRRHHHQLDATLPRAAFDQDHGAGARRVDERHLFEIELETAGLRGDRLLEGLHDGVAVAAVELARDPDRPRAGLRPLLDRDCELWTQRHRPPSQTVPGSEASATTSGPSPRSWLVLASAGRSATAPVSSE